MKQLPPEPGEYASPEAGPLVIGWKEWAALPEWGVRKIKVKVDTGARTSALDVVGYELRPAPGGGQVARLRLVLNRRRSGREVVAEAPVVGVVSVRNTSGVSEQRPVVEATVRLGPRLKRIRLTLADRAGMLHRMILGRAALAGDFVVDVSRKFVLR